MEDLVYLPTSSESIVGVDELCGKAIQMAHILFEYAPYIRSVYIREFGRSVDLNRMPRMSSTQTCELIELSLPILPVKYPGNRGQ